MHLEHLDTDITFLLRERKLPLGTFQMAKWHDFLLDLRQVPVHGDNALHLSCLTACLPKDFKEVLQTLRVFLGPAPTRLKE